eukprot:g1495.t1
MMRAWAALLLWLSLAAGGSARRPHIISILQDDLGFFDSGVHSRDAAAWSRNITALADQGVRLGFHYSHWHCSPSRRSFLTGRLPIHHGEQLSGNAGDDIDLRMDWISDKLVRVGYEAHWFGKYHTGFRSMRHLPAAHGFSNTSVGSLQTGGHYSGPDHSTRWQGWHPIVRDSEFVDKPSQCGADGAENSPCNQSAFMQNTELPCGNSETTFVRASSPSECCEACSRLPECSHWVYSPAPMAPDATQAHGAEQRLPCHLKRGGVPPSCAKTKQGATSGLSIAPDPPRPSSAQCTNEYSTDLWGQLALQAVSEHNASDADHPLYVHLCFQAVHTPYERAPGDPTQSVYRGMLWRADTYVGALVQLLKKKGMYQDTLIVYSSDNGGVLDGTNFPLRGEKHSNWEGGMRVAAFVSGGFVPPNVRGSWNNLTTHLVDWYPTFAALAGASTTDDPPVPPQSPIPSEPWSNTVYGNASFPPVDGVNIWPFITNPSANPDPGAAHPSLLLSKQVLISKGRWKLLVAQPHFKTQNNGWKDQDGPAWDKTPRRVPEYFIRSPEKQGILLASLTSGRILASTWI